MDNSPPICTEHKDTKAQSHKERPHLRVIYAAFLCGFVPLCLCVALLWIASSPAAGMQQRQATGTAILFEGARLLTGDGKAPIENSAFIVANDRFTSVGRKGELQLPPGAARIDLSGKTVMPAMVDVHSHFGFLKQLDGSMSKATSTARICSII